MPHGPNTSCSRRLTRQAVGVLGLLWLSVFARAGEDPKLSNVVPTNEFGRAVQYSLRLMAADPGKLPQPVRVLFYGQSITEQLWSYDVADSLRRRFPHAELIITNLALGYTSELLVKIADTDLYSFYPDLLIFHVYGSLAPYEDIIARTRLRTTADIVIQNDHPTTVEDVNELADLSRLEELSFPAWKNFVALPELAARYSAEFADLRTPWKQYLAEHQLEPRDLLRDHIHPNQPGDALMSQLMQAHLRHDESFPPTNGWDQAVTTYEVGRDIFWTNGTLRARFTGNRIDAILDGAVDQPVSVQIDGQAPSEFPELYRFTRTDRYPRTSWLNLVQINSRAPLLEEEWTLSVQRYLTNDWPPRLQFSVEGSKTGPDGEGTSTNLFVSQSGRVVITPDDWIMIFWGFLSGYPLGERHQVRWRSVFDGRDHLPARPNSGKTVVTLALGLANGTHELTLQGPEAAPAVRALRAYNPLARHQPIDPTPLLLRVEQPTKDSASLSVTGIGRGRYVVESAPGLNEGWRSISAPLREASWTVPIAENRNFFRLRKIE